MTATPTVKVHLTPRSVAGAAAAIVVVEALIAWRFGLSPTLPAYLVFGAAAAVVSATDLAARRIPNRVVGPLYVVGVVLFALASTGSGQWWPLARSGIGMAGLGAFYLLLGLAFERGLGMGDVKWAGVVGLFCGWVGSTTVVTATLLAFAGAFFLVAGHRLAYGGGRKVLVPMAPFMSLGALVAILLAR